MKLLTGAPLSEHCEFPHGRCFSDAISEVGWKPIYFRGIPKLETPCVQFSKDDEGQKVHTSYYIGTDWLEEGELAVYVEPKLNNDQAQTDYFKMLFSALSNTDIGDELTNLFEMKPDKPFITLQAKQDLLTPLLVLQFLQVVERIVQKGLKRSYYTVTQTLRSRVKGKVMVAQTIRSATLKNKPLDTVCSYSEFGYNSIENRIIKKTLGFARRYLHTNRFLQVTDEPYTHLLAYIQPQFEAVSDTASLTELRSVKLNPFYKEYREALSIAQLILKRFAFNINTTSQNETITVPPFWVDMSKLFELYVLGELRKKYGIHDVVYQHKAGTEYPDMLLKSQKVVIDAKYKPSYHEGQKREDIRQLSGYARNKEVLKVFGLDKMPLDCCPVLPCWIIYPAKLADEAEVTLGTDSWKEMPNYVGFYKSPMAIPKQQT